MDSRYGILILGALAACGGGTPNASSPVPELAARREFRALTIVPRVASACPGDVIAAEYKGRLADGSSVTLSRGEVAALARNGTAVDPRDDGSWQTHTEPLASAYDGFRLSAALPSDTRIRADTVVRPTYECLSARNHIDLRGALQDAFKSAYVRLGIFRSPFYDSIVVAVFELSDRPPYAMVLPPSAMSSGAIRIDASGRPGAQGRAGRRGTDGGQCESGGRGEDGDEGGNGGAGGRIDVIVQTEAPWLDRLVAISNGGGPGGMGGRGGLGGNPGTGRTGGASGGCSPRSGRMGNMGRQGSQGPAGPTPRTTNVLFSLLWSGSPIWNDVRARLALEQLIELTRTAR